jgi:hypothetical protein
MEGHFTPRHVRRGTEAARLFRAFALAAVVAVSSVALRRGAPNRSAQSNSCGNAVNGIALCLTLAGTETLSVEIRNAGATDAVLDLGIMLANGTRQYPRAVVLSAQDSAGVELEGTSIDPPVVAGRVDAFVVPLPRGAAVRLPLRLSRYFFHAGAGSTETTIPAGRRYTIRAKLTAIDSDRSAPSVNGRGLPRGSYWTGTAVSNAIVMVMPAAGRRPGQH